MIEITAVTPTMPGREQMLKRAELSVKRQTLKAVRYLVGVDDNCTGHGARIRNALIGAADTEWIACLDDDDIMKRNHLATLAEAASDADVIVSLYEHSDFSPVAEHCCDFAQIVHRNWWHPSSCLLRRDLVLDVGGFPDPAPPAWDDWLCWIKLFRAGARYQCVHEVTSIKGQHASNISRA